MSKAPRSAGGGLLLGAGLGAAIMIAVVTGGSQTEARPASGVEYRPDHAVPRWSGPGFDVNGVGRVADFDVVDDRMYVLDGLHNEVRLLKREAGSWEAAGAFGRKGAGPGEFIAAHGLAATRDGALVVVADDARLHFFDRDGEFLYSRIIATQCRLLRPRVAAGRRGFFVTGNCYRSGPVTDTMTSVLYWTDDGQQYEHIASDVRFTRDGRIGSFLSAPSPFSESDSLHAFGTGTTECYHEIVEKPGEVPAADQVCGVVTRRYSAAASAEFVAGLRAERERRGNTSLLAWPDPLPSYVDRVVANGTVLLLRQFSSDSLVVEVAGGGGAGLLVAGMDILVACRRGGCLWAESTMTGARLRLLDIAELQSALQQPVEADDA